MVQFCSTCRQAFSSTHGACPSCGVAVPGNPLPGSAPATGSVSAQVPAQVPETALAPPSQSAGQEGAAPSPSDFDTLSMGAIPVAPVTSEGVGGPGQAIGVAGSHATATATPNAVAPRPYQRNQGAAPLPYQQSTTKFDLNGQRPTHDAAVIPGEGVSHGAPPPALEGPVPRATLAGVPTAPKGASSAQTLTESSDLQRTSTLAGAAGPVVAGDLFPESSSVTGSGVSGAGYPGSASPTSQTFTESSGLSLLAEVTRARTGSTPPSVDSGGPASHGGHHLSVSGTIPVAAGPASVPPGYATAPPPSRTLSVAPLPAPPRTVSTAPAGTGPQPLQTDFQSNAIGRPADRTQLEQEGRATGEHTKPDPDAYGGPPTHSNLPQPRPGRIAAGVFVLAIGLWLLIALLPTHKPLGTDALVKAMAETGQTAAELMSERLSAGTYRAGQLGGVAFIVFGLAMAAIGFRYRETIPAVCRSCHSQVVAWRVPFGARCPQCNHYAIVDWAPLVATGVFLLLTLVVGTSLIVAFIA